MSTRLCPPNSAAVQGHERPRHSQGTAPATHLMAHTHTFTNLYICVSACVCTQAAGLSQLKSCAETPPFVPPPGSQNNLGSQLKSELSNMQCSHIIVRGLAARHLPEAHRILTANFHPTLFLCRNTSARATSRAIRCPLRIHLSSPFLSWAMASIRSPPAIYSRTMMAPSLFRHAP